MEDGEVKDVVNLRRVMITTIVDFKNSSLFLLKKWVLLQHLMTIQN